MSAARVVPMEAPGDILAPSVINTYTGCGVKYYYRKIRRLPDPKTGALLVGSCVHDALGENFRQKCETKKDLPVSAVKALYRNAWEKLAPETEFHPTEIPGDLYATGEALALKYLNEAAPCIEPAAVELPVAGVIGGVRVRGYIDILDVRGCVHEIKTAARKPSEVSADYRVQVATYRKLCPQASGEASVETLVKTKTPQLVPLTYTVQPCDIVRIERLYPDVQRAIRAGIFLTNRASNLCSRKYCAFWRACEREHGGEVSE